MALLLLSLRPSPSPRLPLCCLLLCRCSSAWASATPSSSLAPYHAAFARRMALAGIHPHHRIAVGVSGGPDSMALCVLTAAWKNEAEWKSGEEVSVVSRFVDGLVGVVVDHGLRPESSEEAQLVRDRVRGMGVQCEIAKCEWPDGRPKQGHVQEAAREMRKSNILAAEPESTLDSEEDGESEEVEDGESSRALAHPLVGLRPTGAATRFLDHSDDEITTPKSSPYSSSS